MQNAWRFVEDEMLRERLKEAKGHWHPCNPGGNYRDSSDRSFWLLKEEYCPTDTGLKLFGVLQHADPVLVDPGATAQLECLLDDVVVGKQEMVGAIDAVCDVALAQS